MINSYSLQRLHLVFLPLLSSPHTSVTCPGRALSLQQPRTSAECGRKRRSHSVQHSPADHAAHCRSSSTQIQTCTQEDCRHSDGRNSKQIIPDSEEHVHTHGNQADKRIEIVCLACRSIGSRNLRVATSVS